MGKGILKKKRTRLVALLAALCAVLAVGIGAGAAAASRAAERKQETGASKIAYPKVRVIKPGDGAEAVLASDNPCNTTYTKANMYGSCHDWGTWSNFNSSAQIFNAVATPQIYGGWAGQSFSASVDLGAGISMPITAPIGLWNGTEFQNPNNLTPGETEASMMNGDYMGSIAVFPVDNAADYHSLLGGVSYDGTLNTAMKNYLAGSNGQSLLDSIGLDDSSSGFGYTFNPESIQYMFQYDCNNSEILNNSYFAKMAALSSSELQATLNDLIFGKEGLYTTDETFYGSIPDSTVSGYFADLKSEGENLASQSTVEEYQKAFEAYAVAAEKYGVTDSTSPTSTSYQEARQAYLNALGKDASNDQPLLCLAAWDQNVGYQHFPKTESLYTQGSTTTGSPFNGGDTSSTYPYAYWGAGPSYQGSSNTADGTLEVEVSPVATDFLYSVMGGNSNSVTAGDAGIELMAMYQTNQTSASYSSQGAQVKVNVKPISSDSGTLIANGTYLQINFNSLGQSPTSVNPTSLPSGVTLSTSSPASDGLYFKAVSQSGEPLKSVEMELIPEGNGGGKGYYGAWKNGETPIAPATNSAPSTVDGTQVWADSGNTYWAGFYHPIPFTADSLSSQEGWFDFSGVGPGAYEVKILSGTTESGKTASYGSYYTEPTFEINASSYSSPETVSAVTDPCGFVDPSADEVVVGAENPSSSITQGATSPKSGTKDPYTATVGSSNPFTYQAEAYMPFDLSGQKGASSSPLSFSLSSLPSGEVVDAGSIEVNGKSLSSLKVTPTSSSSGFSFSLSPSQISSAGSQGATVTVSWNSYLESSFASPGSPKFEFEYKAYGEDNSGDAAEDLTPVSTNGPAGQDYSKVSLDPASSPSSETGLWFKDLQADGAESTGAKFEVQNSSGQYLNGDPSNFSGWTWSSTPQQFSASSLGTGTFAFGGLADGTYFVTLTQWPEGMMKGTEGNGENTGKDNWASAPYPMGVATGSAATDSFQVVLSYSSPEDMTSINDPAGLVDHSSDSMYSLAPVKMAPMSGSSLSTQAYQTETVGIPFTEGWEGYLPFDSVNPYSSTLSSGIQVAFPEGDGGLDNGGNSSGLQMDSPAASNVEVAGIPLSQLISKGGLPSSDVTSSAGIYTIEIPGSVLSYIENNGKNEAGEPLSSSSNRLVIISFPALMTTSFKEGGQFQQWMALGADDGWWIQNPGGAWGVYSSPLYTNGSASNSAPSVSDFSHSTSGQTGIWFKSLWWGRNTPAQGAKFTVSQTQGGKTVYLTPVESGGDFTGWSWQSSPYDFTEQNSDADFSMGGLQDGTYTVTEVDPATGATPSSLVFTSSLSYSSPEALSDVKDSLHLLSSSQGVVYNMVVPSSLPLTGGSWVLIVSSAAVLLFAAGAVMFMVRKKRKA